MMIRHAQSARLLHILCSTQRSSLQPQADLIRRLQWYTNDNGSATSDPDRFRNRSAETFCSRYYSSNPLPPGCPPLTQIDDSPKDTSKKNDTVQKTPSTLGSTSASHLTPPSNCPPNSESPKRVESSSSQQNQNGDGGGSNKKWLLGLLALAFGGAAAYFYAFVDDESSKTAKDKKKIGRTVKRQRLTPSTVKTPPVAAELPKHVQYLLIGGGTSCFSAFRSIKSLDPKAEVLLIGNEPEFPYMRPPLSKEMWMSDRSMRDSMVFRQWNGSVRSVYYEPDTFYMEPKALPGSNKGGVAVARGWSVSQIDAVNKNVTLDDGTVISYEKCLLAPGSKPKPFPPLENASAEVMNKVFYFRNVFDFKDLSNVTECGKNVTIIGGGYLGSELACSLIHSGCSVTQIFRETGLLNKLLPKYLSKWLTEQVEAEGVEIISDSVVESVSSRGNKIVVQLTNGKKVESDYCVVATGAVPNTDLAAVSNLETHPSLGGYLVNAEMLARSNLYIAGDAACFFDEKHGRRRVEHHDHAVVSGRLAGENMVGATKPYTHVSMLWSDLSPDIGWEAVGILDPTLPTTGVFALETKKEGESEGNEDSTKTAAKEQFSKGVVFYQKDGVIVGVLLWNVFNRMQLARQILKMGCKNEDINEVAKLFQIHAD